MRICKHMTEHELKSQIKIGHHHRTKLNIWSHDENVYAYASETTYWTIHFEIKIDWNIPWTVLYHVCILCCFEIKDGNHYRKKIHKLHTNHHWTCNKQTVYNQTNGTRSNESVVQVYLFNNRIEAYK